MSGEIEILKRIKGLFPGWKVEKPGMLI